MSKLSKKELAALDLLIAHIEEGGDATEFGLFSSAVNAVTSAVSHVTNVTNAISNPSIANVMALIGPEGIGAHANVGPVQASFAAQANNSGVVFGANVFGDNAPADGQNIPKIDAETTLSELIELRKSNS